MLGLTGLRRNELFPSLLRHGAVCADHVPNPQTPPSVVVAGLIRGCLWRSDHCSFKAHRPAIAAMIETFHEIQTIQDLELNVGFGSRERELWSPIATVEDPAASGKSGPRIIIPNSASKT